MSLRHRQGSIAAAVESADREVAPLILYLIGSALVIMSREAVTAVSLALIAGMLSPWLTRQWHAALVFFGACTLSTILFVIVVSVLGGLRVLGGGNGASYVALGAGLGTLVGSSLVFFRAMDMYGMTRCGRWLKLGPNPLAATLAAFRSMSVGRELTVQTIRALQLRGLHRGRLQGVLVFLECVLVRFLEFLEAFAIQVERVEFDRLHRRMRLGTLRFFVASVYALISLGGAIYAG